jgi:hypothetical protein
MTDDTDDIIHQVFQFRTPDMIDYVALLLKEHRCEKVNSKYVRLEVNNTVPVVDLNLDAASLNPKAEGEAFIPTGFRAALKAGRGISAWRLEIIDPQGKVFRTIQGQGVPPEMMVWDGKGDMGDALVSNQVYSARFWVKDALGNEGQTPTPVSFKAVFR